jgi:hypothetical protein
LSTLSSLIQVWTPSSQNQTIVTFVLGVTYSYDASQFFKTN